MDEYKECGRLWAWGRLEGLQPAFMHDDSCDPAFKGTLIHNAIDYMYQGKCWEEGIDDLITPEMGINNILATKSGSLVHIKRIVESYSAHYGFPDKQYEVTGTEQTLEYPLNEWLTLVCKIDKVAIDRTNSKPLLVDHKTSSSLRAWVEPTVGLSDQFTAYIAAAQANGIKSDTLIVDGISTAKKSLDEYPQENGLFVRYEAYRSPEQVEEWKQRFMFDAARLKFDIENESFTTRQPKACTKFGGCVYRDVCDASPSARTNILNNSFIRLQRPWSVDKIVFEGDK